MFSYTYLSIDFLLYITIIKGHNEFCVTHASWASMLLESQLNDDRGIQKNCRDTKWWDSEAKQLQMDIKRPP